MDNMPETKKEKLPADLSLSLHGVWGGRWFLKSNQDHSDWKFQTYRSNNLSYEMLCEVTSSYNEQKEGYILSGNRLINL